MLIPGNDLMAFLGDESDIRDYSCFASWAKARDMRHDLPIKARLRPTPLGGLYRRSPFQRADEMATELCWLRQDALGVAPDREDYDTPYVRIGPQELL